MNRTTVCTVTLLGMGSIILIFVMTLVTPDSLEIGQQMGIFSGLMSIVLLIRYYTQEHRLHIVSNSVGGVIGGLSIYTLVLGYHDLPIDTMPAVLFSILMMIGLWHYIPFLRPPTSLTHSTNQAIRMSKQKLTRWTMIDSDDCHQITKTVEYAHYLRTIMTTAWLSHHYTDITGNPHIAKKWRNN